MFLSGKKPPTIFTTIVDRLNGECGVARGSTDFLPPYRRQPVSLNTRTTIANATVFVS